MEVPNPGTLDGDNGLHDTPIGMVSDSDTVDENWLTADTVMMEFMFLPMSVGGGVVTVIVKSANLNMVVVECVSVVLVAVRLSV